MRAITRAAGTLSAAAALSVAVIGVAGADRGDGNLACNSGEICFSQHASGNGGQRHFWYGAEHSDAGNFTNQDGTSGVRFYHNASAIKNRDTETAVCVEESGDVWNDKWTFGRSNSWVNFGTDLNDENARHWRSAC